MRRINLTKREAKLILGIMDTTKYDNYWELWEFVDKKEIEKIQNKMEMVINET